MTAERRCVVLAVSGSVAVYKACEVASTLVQKGYRVPVALTPSAARLVTPVLFRAITGEPAVVDEFAPDAPAAMTHIALADAADAFLVAPASADVLARLALGLANDLVTTTALALRPEAKRLFAPAMNARMLANPVVKRNVDALRALGWQAIDPESGHLACGVEGPGRLADPAKVVAAVERALSR